MIGFRFAWMTVIKSKQTIHIGLNYKCICSFKKTALAFIAFMSLTKATVRPYLEK